MAYISEIAQIDKARTSTAEFSFASLASSFERSSAAFSSGERRFCLEALMMSPGRAELWERFDLLDMGGRKKE